MREMLFRGKRKDNGNWIEGKGIDLNFGDVYILTKEYDSESGYYIGEYQVIPETVGQFTGCCDKNGTKIFEGDIISETLLESRKTGKKTNTFEIRFDKGRFCAFKDNENVNSMLVYSSFSEVVGNIHDNKEIIK